MCSTALALSFVPFDHSRHRRSVEFLIGFPAFLQPYIWRTNTLRTIIEPRMEPLQLLQPNGQPFLKLNTHVRVELLVNQ